MLYCMSVRLNNDYLTILQQALKVSILPRSFFVSENVIKNYLTWHCATKHLGYFKFPKIKCV